MTSDLQCFCSGSTLSNNAVDVSSKKQAGLSLVELMVSVVLGLLLLAAAYNMYTGNMRSARFTQGVQALQENGRHSIALLQKGLRLAGYVPQPTMASRIKSVVIDSSSSESITIMAMQPYDCNGQSSTPTGGVVRNTYAFNAATQQVTCTGNQSGSLPMPVIDGVEAFRVLYGVDEKPSDSTCEPQRYVSYDPALDRHKIVALRVAVLIHSVDPVRNQKADQVFVVLDREVVLPQDKMAREVFRTTVLLRNNMACTRV